MYLYLYMVVGECSLGGGVCVLWRECTLCGERALCGERDIDLSCERWGECDLCGERWGERDIRWGERDIRCGERDIRCGGERGERESAIKSKICNWNCFDNNSFEKNIWMNLVNLK